MNCIEPHEILSTAVLYDSGISCNNSLYKDKDCFSRKFIYRFGEHISIDNIKYPVVDKEITYYEIYEVTETNKDELIFVGLFTSKQKSPLVEIFLNGINVKDIKIYIKNKTNLWPDSSEIIFEKSKI